MKTIPGELIKFKEVEGALDSILTATDRLESCASDSASAINNAIEDIKSNYKSSNRDAVISRFTSCVSEYNSISSALSNTLKSIISNCKDLITLINKLEEINNSIARLEDEKNERISRAKDDEKVYTSDLDEQIRTLEGDFDSVLSDASSLLSRIKSMDASI